MKALKEKCLSIAVRFIYITAGSIGAILSAAIVIFVMLSIFYLISSLFVDEYVMDLDENGHEIYRKIIK